MGSFIGIGLAADIFRATRVPIIALLMALAARTGLEFTPQAFKQIELAEKTLTVISVFIVVWGLDRVVRVLLREAAKRGSLSQGFSAILRNISRLLIYAIGFLVAIDGLGVSITPILASLGVGSLAVALALQDTLSNVFSAFYILVDRPFKIGDYIRLEDNTEGAILSIGWRSTHIRLQSEDTVVLPNSKLSSSTLINYSMPENGSVIHLPVGVAYESDLDHVRDITIRCAKEVILRLDVAVNDFEPFVRFKAFGASSIDLTVAVKVRRYADRFLLQHELIMSINREYRTAGINIPFPQHVVHMAKPAV